MREGGHALISRLALELYPAQPEPDRDVRAEREDAEDSELLDRIERTGGNVRFPEPSHGLSLGERADPSVDDRDYLLPMRDALGIVGETLVLEQLVEIERAAEALEKRVVRDADVHVAVARP